MHIIQANISNQPFEHSVKLASAAKILSIGTGSKSAANRVDATVQISKELAAAEQVAKGQLQE
ncbi:hypothetical protein A4A49_57152, partial [Nicotiana attenuata]